MIFQNEGFGAVKDIIPLLSEHSSYVFGPDFVLNPDLEWYEQAMKDYRYVIFTARDQGELVGYAGFFIGNSIHSKKLKLANCDLIFMLPEFRGQGHLLIEYCNNSFLQNGVNEVLHSVTVSHDYSKTLTRLGFTEFERLFVKVLK